jgi:succinate dehydrogenase / fumarate reductase flavoprotein subunit
MLTFHDSPRRAHSIAAQGGINAAKNYRNDGDTCTASSTTREGRRLPRREANVLPARRS